MPLHYLLIKPGLVIPVKSYMSSVIPVSKLVDDGMIKLIRHFHKGPFLRINISRAESAGGIAAVNGLNIYNIGFRRFFRIQEIIAIFLLGLAPG